MKIIGIIPARFASTRFPGKPLADIHGKTMIQRVIEQARKSSVLSDVLVATDDERIQKHVLSLGENVMMTHSKHQSGTDRCLEALQKFNKSFDAVINIQGDEPFAEPSQIEALVNLIARNDVQIATLAIKMNDPEALFNHNKVKVVIGENGQALYFSRQAIPYQKGVESKDWLFHFAYYKHIGLYAYKSDVLKQICNFQPSPLEKAESLEQLRWLENGLRIHVALTDIETPAVDTPADLERILKGK